MDDSTNRKPVGIKLLLKSGFWYTLSDFLTKATVFLTTPIFSRILTNEEYGNFTVFASWQAIFVIICGMEIYGTINRARFDFTNEGELDGYIASCLTLSTGLTSVFFIAFLLFPNVFYDILLLDKKYILVMFAYLFTYPALAMFQSKQRIEYKYKISAGISFVLVISSSALAVLLVYLLPDDRLYGRVIGQYMLYALTGLMFYIYFIKKSHAFSIKAYKYALRIGLPLVFSYLGSRILLSSDNLILKHLCTGKEVSYLSVTHTCAQIILLLVQALSGAWAPWFYDKLSTGEYKLISNTLSVYVYLIIIATLGAVLLAPEIIAILGGSRYGESLYILPANITCGVFTALTSQFANLETFHKKPEYAGILTASVAVMNIVLDIIGVKLWGYRAVCYVTVLCNVVLVILHYRLTLSMNIRKLLPLRRLTVMTTATLTLIPIALLLYQNNLIRWTTICVLMVACITIVIIKRNEIKALLVRFKVEKT